MRHYNSVAFINYEFEGRDLKFEYERHNDEIKFTKIDECLDDETFEFLKKDVIKFILSLDKE